MREGSITPGVQDALSRARRGLERRPQDPRTNLAGQLRRKSEQCGALGSPLYEELLARAAEDVEGGGPSWEVLRARADDPEDSALALRFASAVHRHVLEGQAPGLAHHYPSAGGTVGEPGLWDAFQQVLSDHHERLRALIALPVQTNEVGRSAALLPGFLLVAREHGLPLRLLELGASAGLNLIFDRYRYEAGGGTLGPPGSPVRFRDSFAGDAPSLELESPMRIKTRRGCDAHPLDVGSEETRLALLSVTWPDQPERLARLQAALNLASSDPPSVDRADAVEWAEAQLRESREGTATVVFHSIFWQYLPPTKRRRLVEVLREAGRRASPGAPLAWLRMEPPGKLAGVRLTSWPGGAERLIARAGYYGPPVRIIPARHLGSQQRSSPSPS